MRGGAGAAGISETQDALGTQASGSPQLGKWQIIRWSPAWKLELLGKAEGDVTVNTAGTRTCVSEDLPETGTTYECSLVRLLPAVLGALGTQAAQKGPLRMDAEGRPRWGLPGRAPLQAEEQPRPEFPAFMRMGR